jgi:hypothetical protein
VPGQQVGHDEAQPLHLAVQSQCPRRSVTVARSFGVFGCCTEAVQCRAGDRHRTLVSAGGSLGQQGGERVVRRRRRPTRTSHQPLAGEVPHDGLPVAQPCEQQRGCRVRLATDRPQQAGDGIYAVGRAPGRPR